MVRVFQNCTNVHLHTYQWMKLVDQVNHQQCLFYKFASTYQWVRHAVQLIPPMIFLRTSLQTDFHFEKNSQKLNGSRIILFCDNFSVNFWPFFCVLMVADLICQMQKSADRQSVAGLDEFYIFWVALVHFLAGLGPWFMNPWLYLRNLRSTPSYHHLWLFGSLFHTLKHDTFVCTLIIIHKSNKDMSMSIMHLIYFV